MARAEVLLAGLCLVLWARVSSADIYSFVDRAGVAHYTNVPVDPRYEFLLASPSEKTRSGDSYDPMVLAAAAQFDPLIDSAATAAALAPELLRAVIAVESGFNSRAVSRAGAAGLMQLMPATARRFGVRDRFDPAQNIQGGARYLRSLINRYDNNIRLALAAYNAGENAVDRCGRCIPSYKETQAYVPRVLQLYQRLLASLEPG